MSRRSLVVAGMWVRIVGHETGWKGRGQITEGQIRENMYNVSKQMFRDSPVNYNSLVKYLKEGREIFFFSLKKYFQS